MEQSFKAKSNTDKTIKSQINDERYLQWLKNIHEELNQQSSNSNNERTIARLNKLQQKDNQQYEKNKNKSKFNYVIQNSNTSAQQKLKNSIKKTSTMKSETQKQQSEYSYSYKPTQEYQIKRCNELYLVDEEKQNQNKKQKILQENINVIPISHRRERSPSPIKVEQLQACNQNLNSHLEKKGQNTPKVSLQYYSKKWNSPEVLISKQKQVRISQFNSAQNTNKSKIFGQTTPSNYSTLKKSSLALNLQQKDEEYIKNVYPQTIKYLSDMLQTLAQDKSLLINWKHTIKEQYFKAIDEKGQVIKNNLFKIIEQSLIEWKQKQYKNFEKNQMKYLGELLQVQDMIQQRQNQLSMLQNRLQEDLRNYRQISSDISIRNTFSDILSGNHKDQIISLSKQLQSAIQNSCQLSNRLTKQISIQQMNKMNEFALLRQSILGCFQTFRQSSKQIGLIKNKSNNAKLKEYEPNFSITKSNNKRFLQQEQEKPTKIKKNQSSKSLLKNYQKIYSDFKKDFDKKYENFILQSAKQKSNRKNQQNKAQKEKKQLQKRQIYTD